MQKINDAVRYFFDLLFITVGHVCKLLLAVEVVVISYSVFMRYVLHSSPTGAPQFALICMIWFSMMSAALAARTNIHVRLSIMDSIFPQRLTHSFAFVNNLLILFFGLFLSIYGFDLIDSTRKATLPALTGWPLSALYIPLPVTGILFILVFIEKTLQGRLFTWTRS